MITLAIETVCGIDHLPVRGEEIEAHRVEHQPFVPEFIALFDPRAGWDAFGAMIAQVLGNELNRRKRGEA